MRPDRRLFLKCFLALSALSSALGFALPLLRDQALSNSTMGGGGNVPGYNLYFDWEDDFGEGRFRALICPFYKDPPPWNDYPYSSSDKLNPLCTSIDRRAVRYGGELINYPLGTDTAVVGLDGNVSFLKLAPKYLRYGEAQTWRVGPFVARKRFPAQGMDKVDIELLRADGLLPEWAILKDDANRVVVRSAPTQVLDERPVYSYDWPTLAAYLLAIVGLIGFPLMFRSIRRDDRARRAQRTGTCAVCGYDLRSSPGRCPECGTAVSTGEAPLAEGSVPGCGASQH